MIETYWGKAFLAKDYHDKGEIEFAKCHTEKILVDMLTKLKQGTPFRNYRTMLMNVSPPTKSWQREAIYTNSSSNPTIEQSRTSNRRRIVLESPMINSKPRPSQAEPDPNKTRNSKIPVTKSNHVPQVSWADIVRKKSIRKNNTTNARPQDSHGSYGLSRRYATRMAGLWFIAH